MPTLKAKPKKKLTPKKKARKAMTTTAPVTSQHQVEKAQHPVDRTHPNKGIPTGDFPGKGGKPIEEMTHAEHKAYLIREAEENERVNDEIYQKTVDEIPSPTEVLTPTSTTNDDLRAKALEQTDIAVAAAKVQRTPYLKDADKDRADRDRADKEKADKDRADKEKADREKADREKSK